MAHIRGPDGRPIDEEDENSEAATRRVSGKRSIRDRLSSPTSDGDAPTGGRRSSGNEDATAGRRAADDDAGIESGDGPAREGAQVTPDPAEDEGGRTRIVGPRRKERSGEAEQSASAAPASARRATVSPMDDPVVGWLVIVDGPGKGAATPLGYGMNSIGRASTERVQIDFGDDEISRSQHALVTYDPKSRKFFVQHGGGRNLTYLGADNQPVLTPIELHGGEEINVGSTKLRFVPFCGSDFDWNDQ